MLQFNHFKGRCKPMDKRTSTNGNKVLGYIAKRIAVRDTTCFDIIPARAALGVHPCNEAAILNAFRRSMRSPVYSFFLCASISAHKMDEISEEEAVSI